MTKQKTKGLEKVNFHKSSDGRVSISRDDLQEETLSDKERIFHGKFEYPFPRIFYFEEDVKEFIKKTLIDCSEAFESNELEIVENIINKQAGKNLI